MKRKGANDRSLAGLSQSEMSHFFIPFFALTVLLAWELPVNKIGPVFELTASSIGPICRAQARTHFVLLELFTSEGCSSCPAADRYLIELAAPNHPHSDAIITLSFHVDYWDSLGWKDPFARAENTLRQREYAVRLDRGRLYTPELVLNGIYAKVGGDRAQIDELVTRLARNSASPRIEAWVERQMEHHRMKISARVEGQEAACALEVIGFVHERSSSVSRGENSGGNLHHSSVVTSVQKMELDVKGEGQQTVAVDKSDEVVPSGFVFLLRSKRSGKIVGASRCTFSSGMGLN